MTIAKRTLIGGSTRYQASFRIAGRPSISQTFDKRADARKWLSQQKRLSPPKLLEALDNIGANSFSKEEIKTVGEALRHYGEMKTRSKGGAKQELRRISQLCRLPMAAMRLEDMRASTLEKYVVTRIDAGTSGSTLKKELSLISCTYEYLIKKDGREELRNPVLNTDKPIIASARERRMTASEEKAIRKALEALSNAYLLPAFDLAVETGLRRSELLRLTYEDCDFSSHTALVRQARKGRRPESVKPTREIALTQRAIEVINAIGEEERVGKIIKTTAAGIECAWKKLKKERGIADLRWHDLRHECASRMAVRRVPQPIIQQQLGHMSWKQTRKYQTFTRAEMANAVVFSIPVDQKTSTASGDGEPAMLKTQLGLDQLQKLFAQFCEERLVGVNHV